MRAYRLAGGAAAFCASVWSARHGLVWATVASIVVTLAVAIAHALRRTRVACLAPFAVAVAAGSLLAALRPDAPPIAERRTATYRAVVVGCEPAGADGSRLVTLRLDGLTLEAIVRRDALPIGEALVVRGRVAPPDVGRNPGEPSPRDFARDRGVDGTLERATVLATGPVDSADASLWLARARAWGTQRLHAALDEPYASIAAGAIFGERATLPHALREEFQETGTMHVLVTAGLHLGVVAALAVVLLRLAGCGRVSSSLIAIVVVCAYAALSGGHLPALRAAAMATVALLARAGGRRALSWNALGAAAIVVVAIRPSSIDGISFALSFSCVAAIVLLAEPLQSLLEDLPLPHAGREAIALTLATQLGTWPLTAAAFLTIAPYAPLANLFVVPVVGFVMALGGGLVVFADVPIVGHVLANAETTMLAWIVGVVERVAALPGARVLATPPPTWTIVLYDLALVAAALLSRRERRLAAALVLASACALCVMAPEWPSHDLRIVVLDVGQADAIVITTPAGHAFLVDAGGRLERGPSTGSDSKAEAVGERIVVPYLLRHGIRHLDALLLTHPHGDHVGGAVPVLRALRVDALADSGQAYPGHAYRATMAYASERDVPVLEPRGGTIWTTDDGVTFRFYGPTLPYITGSRSDINSNSLVFRLEYRAFSMLFTGDAGTDTEQRLLAARDDLRSDVLKVGHHGSAYGTSDAFLRAVAPRYAIVSVGRHNLFGHPASSTIAELRARLAVVERTDLNGAVSVSSDGRRFQVTPYVGLRMP